MATVYPAPSILPRDGMCLATPNYPWVQLNSGVPSPDTSGATVLDLTGDIDLYFSNIIGDPAQLTPESGKIDLRRYFGASANGYMLQFWGTGNADTVFGFDLYAFRKDRPGGAGYGTPVYLSANTCALGTMVCDLYPAGSSGGSAVINGKWADTISGTACGPFGAAVHDTGNDRIATLTFDGRGFEYLYIRVFTDSDLTEATSVFALLSAY